MIFSYRKTAAVYTRRFSLLEVTPDRTPIRPSARISSNSKIYQLHHLYNFSIQTKSENCQLQLINNIGFS